MSLLLYDTFSEPTEVGLPEKQRSWFLKTSLAVLAEEITIV